MPTLAAADHWLNTALREAPELPRHAGLSALRAQATAFLAEASLPSARDEDWRFTSLAPLTAHTYQTHSTPGRILLPILSRFVLPEAEGRRLTFVDGHFVPELSSLADLGSITLKPFSACEDRLPPGLGALVAPDENAVTALAAAFTQDGAWLDIPANVEEARPIHLLFVSSGGQTASRIAPRVFISMGAGAKATVVQAYVTTEEAVQAVHAITEVLLAEGSDLTHIRVQSDSRQGSHFERWAARLERHARYTLRNITLGARLSRFDVSIDGADTEIDATLDGLALLAGEQEADTRSRLIHRKAHGRSRQSQRMILDGRSHAVFQGLIKVHPQAQQTDSAQSSRGLLLSNTARIDTKPELAIEADDVKCAHGAAIGQLDAEQLFYLRARGISEPDARALLTYAFAAEVLDNIPVPTLRKQLKAVLLGRTQAEVRPS